MISIALNGLITGLMLQLAIGPVFFFILNIALQETLINALFAVLAVTIADYIYITLAILGIGKLLEHGKIKKTLGLLSSIVLILFGLFMALPITELSYDIKSLASDSYLSNFSSAFILTISSPLTIVFWAGIFTAKAIDLNYTKRQLLIFGLFAGSSTLLFLGLSSFIISMIKTSIPSNMIYFLNMAIGMILVVYGLLRILKLFFNKPVRL